MFGFLEFISALTVAQIFAHMVGDYPLQSGWMAVEKTKRWIPAIVHGLVYSIPFVLIFQPSLPAYAVIVGTHVIIDRFRLAKHVCWAKSWLSPTRPAPWSEAKENWGHDKNTPEWMAAWLMIIVDNLMHITCNAWALWFFQ